MDDDVCRECIRVGKNGGIRCECQCASTLKSVKLYSAANSAQTCQTTAYSQLVAIILLTAGLARGPRSELSPILGKIVLFMYKVTYSRIFSNSYVSSRLVKCIYNSACGTVNLVQSFW